MLCKFLSFALLTTSACYCQTLTGGIQGVVTDPHGALIQNAQVSIRNPLTEVVWRTQTDADGAFRKDGLQPARYEVTVTANNFAEAKTRITVRVGEINWLKIGLRVGPASESVEVHENASNRKSAVLGNPVSESEIQQTPLANRSFANIAYIAPMTAPVEPSDPTKARITAVSFAGSSGLNVDLSVDGGDNNDDYIGGFLQNFSPEAIQEFTVRTAQFEPDTSRTNGGSVIINTRSGTNDWHAGFLGFFRSTALNARNDIDNPEPNPKQPFSKQDYVAMLGAPLIKKRLWLFTSFEYNRENASVAYSNFSLSQFRALADLASAALIPGVSRIDVPTSVTTPFRDSLYNSRLDWQQSQASRWFLRFSLDRYKTINDLVQQGSLPSTGFTTRSNYYNVLVSNELSINPNWLGSLVIEGSLFDHAKVRNSNIGLALAFPFTTTTLTTSGFETFGDNQFVTAITAFPINRNQQKYQFRYDVSHSTSAHNVKFGINVIHEPVLSGRFADTAETLVQFPQNPGFYASNPSQFTADFTANSTPVPSTKGVFGQNIQRLGIYGQDNWSINPNFALSYGLRYDTTFGLFLASGRDQNANPTLQALRSAGVSFAKGIPRDYRGAISPRLGIAYSPGRGNTIIRAGFGLFYNDLAQNGWAQAFQAVNGGQNPPTAVIDARYHSPYALQASVALERALSQNWKVAVQYEHQEGNHQYRRYEYVSGISLPSSAPSTSVFKTDNRSTYNGASFILQRRGARYDLTAHYTLAKASTWGATVGELFDYVNGVTNALMPFGLGDNGPSGEDIRHRFVINAVLDLPKSFKLSTLAQFESARPYTMFTPVDINGDGNVNDRAVVNGVPTSLDEFRGKPFEQVDLRVSREFRFSERIALRPFAEFFNLFNRSNPGNNYIPDISALPLRVNNLANASGFCLNDSCTSTRPIRSLSDLKFPAGALGDFFGPGTTVGVPFAAQIGFRLVF
jgi:Carboxypeptidase regulatory-like domain